MNKNPFSHLNRKKRPASAKKLGISFLYGAEGFEADLDDTIQELLNNKPKNPQPSKDQTKYSIDIGLELLTQLEVLSLFKT